MKYCTKCGNELMEDAVICPHCGCAQEQINAPRQSDGSNWMAIVGFVGAFFVPLVGWIFGALGLKKSKELLYEKGKKLSIAAIIIASVMFVFNIIISMYVQQALIDMISGML